MPINHVYRPVDPLLNLYVDGQGSRCQNNKIIDLSGNGNHATAMGATYKPGPTGKSVLNFDGDDYIRTPNIIRDPIGIEIDTSSLSPTLRYIDIDGDYISPNDAYLNNHEIFRDIWACTLTADGTPTYGSDPRGTGLDLTGASGDVMSRYPNIQFKYELNGNYQHFWIAPFHSSHIYFKYHPSCYSGGGTPHDHWFGAVFEAHGYLDPVDSTFKLGSATGKQPITGGVSYPNCPNSGRFTIDDAIQFAKNKGEGWSAGNIYSEALWQLLYYVRYGSLNSQTKSGLGIVNKVSGSGFAGSNTGSDSINSNLDYWGTGKGTGSDGLVAISVMNRQNPWGNIWKFVPGVNVMSNGTCRVTKQDGTGTLAGTLPTGSYETLPGTLPLTDNYVSKIQTDELGALTFSPLQVSGTSTSGICDYYYHSAIDPATVYYGGAWNGGLTVGIGDRFAPNAPSFSNRYVGARLVYTP